MTALTRSILIILFSLIFSRLSLAATEAGACLACSGNEQPSAPFAVVDPEKIQMAIVGWINLKVPMTTQTSQLDAGYPNGCEITAILYALKFGPSPYQVAYASIPGRTDVEKIRALALKIGALQSKDNPARRVFSERYGTNPNDLSWVFQSLVPGSKAPSTANFIALSGVPVAESKMLVELQQRATQSLSQNRPIIAQLLYTAPNFSHAIVITGIESRVSVRGELSLRIFDPGTGQESVARVTSGTGKYGDINFKGLNFSDPDIEPANGYLVGALF